MLSLDLGINKNKVTLNIFIPCQFHTCNIMYLIIYTLPLLSPMSSLPIKRHLLPNKFPHTSLCPTELYEVTYKEPIYWSVDNYLVTV